MLSNQEIEQRFKNREEVVYVKVEGDGYHYQLTIVSDQFCNQPKVKRQQWVYAQLKDLITTGVLHALNINTWTKDEWEKHHG